MESESSFRAIVLLEYGIGYHAIVPPPILLPFDPVSHFVLRRREIPLSFYAFSKEFAQWVCLISPFPLLCAIQLHSPSSWLFKRMIKPQGCSNESGCKMQRKTCHSSYDNSDAHEDVQCLAMSV